MVVQKSKIIFAFSPFGSILNTMKTILFIAALIAMLGVLVVLGLGMFAMAKGGEFNKKYGNLFMQWRVYLQALAIGLLGLAYYVSQSG